MTIDIKPSEVVFFLGAGASVHAGVPDTYSFVDKFINNIEDTWKRQTIEKIVQTLKGWKGSDIDVELLLETLTKLKDREKEPLIQFHKDGRFELNGYYNKEPLIEDLKDFIKSKTIVPELNVQYLQPLRDFVEEERMKPLDIISVNYDICIEQFCNVNKLVYQDGFDVHWNPMVFGREHTDVRLYKLHGSVMWYQTDRGGYVKLPVMTGKSKIELITGEKAENLMLYPMQKWDYAEPLLELLVEIKKLLESKECKSLIVVGYSFRDDHIRRILLDSARKNKELHLILIDPKAFLIYSEKLKYYDVDHRIRSSLYERVVCLPYKFQEVFPYLKNFYIKNLENGLSNETAKRQIEIKGEKPNWLDPLRLFIKAEWTEKIETLSNRIDRLELEKDWHLSLELPLRMAFNLLYNGQILKAKKHLSDFTKSLNVIAIEGINVDVTLTEVEIHFTYQCSDSSLIRIWTQQLGEAIETLSEFCETRNKFVIDIREEFQDIAKKLMHLKSYFVLFKEGRIKLEKYIQFRKNIEPDIERLKNEIDETVDIERTELMYQSLAPKIKEIERKILEEILKRG